MRPVDYYRGSPEEIKKLRDEKLAIAKDMNSRKKAQKIQNIL